jgi:hypothetical protein
MSGLTDNARAEENDIIAAVQAGLADAEAGRYITVASAEDRERLQALLLAQALQRHPAGTKVDSSFSGPRVHGTGTDAPQP